MRQKNVSIKANQVDVISTKKNKKNKRKRSQKRSNTNGVIYPAPSGIQTAMSGIVPDESIGPVYGPGRNPMRPDPYAVEGFSDQAKFFIERYCDPCGEHCSSLDSARVPDGALQTSAGGFFRGITAVAFPWQEAGSVDLSGKTYSMLFLQLPLFRSLTFIIANEKDGEFSNEEMNRFAVKFAQLPDPSLALYPKWVSLGDPSVLEYFTILDTLALRNVFPPGPSGVSGTVDSYRFTSQGMNIMFNTPDLVDQGTYTSMRYPANISERAEMIESEIANGQVVYLRAYGEVFTANVDGTRLNLNTTPGNIGFDLFPSYVGSIADLPSPNFTAPARLTIGSGTWDCIAGSVLRYESLPTDRGTIQLVNLSNTNRITILSVLGTRVGDIFIDSTRFYQFGNEDGPETAVDIEVTTLTIPPVTQAAMLQENPKTSASLAKDTEGVYIPSSIFQPIFNVTHASEYRKVVLLTKDVDVRELVDPFAGWSDTIDKNFSVSVVNFQGIPYACKPFVKICRGVEIVPSNDSIVGIFTTGAPDEQTEALDICKAFTQNQPHGYPSNYNGLGILFGKVLRVCESIPSMLRIGSNVSREVKKICDREIIEEVREPIDRLLATGFKRLMRTH